MSVSAAAAPDPAAKDVLDDPTAAIHQAEQQMGAVEPLLKMQLRKQTAHLVR